MKKSVYTRTTAALLSAVVAMQAFPFAAMADSSDEIPPDFTQNIDDLITSIPESQSLSISTLEEASPSINDTDSSNKEVLQPTDNYVTTFQLDSVDSELAIAEQSPNDNALKTVTNVPAFISKAYPAKAYNGHKYQLVYVKNGNWNQVESYAESINGYLACITSSDENDFLYDYLTSNNMADAYFGFTDKDEEGNWKWVSGEETNYTNWHIGEPSNQGNYEHYGLFYSRFHNSQWNDGGGGGDCAYLIEWDNENATSLPEGDNVKSDSDVNRRTFNGHTYQLVRTDMNWADARDWCANAGGHLVTINSEDENTFLKGWMDEISSGRIEFFIGLDTSSSADVNAWITGEPLSYTNWNAGKPSGVGISIFRSTDGEWRSQSYNKYWSVCEWDCTDSSKDDDTQTKVEKELLEKVKLYTDPTVTQSRKYFLELVDQLKATNASKDETLKVLNAFFTQLGYSDINEGINYINDATNAQYAYDFLLNDDVYLAYQYAYWLNYTTKGNVTRGLLMTDDWIFNNNTIAQIADPDVWITQETKSIKNYKSMLLDFMDSDRALDFSAADDVKKYGKNCIRILKASLDITDATMDKKIDKMFNEAKTVDECKAAMEMVLKNYAPTEGSHAMQFELDSLPEFKKLFNAAGTILTVSSDAIDLLNCVVNLETQLEDLAEYKQFLQSIVNGRDVLPFAMVLAAQELLQQLEEGWEAPLKELGQSLCKFTAGSNVLDLSKKAEEKISKELVEKLGLAEATVKTLGDAAATVKLGAFCVDIATGIGKTVEKSACVEGYALLGLYYDTLLMKSAEAFRADPSVDNAWDFFDKYQLLFEIREQGEDCYKGLLESSDLMNTLIRCGYNLFNVGTNVNDSKQFVKETVDYLNDNCYFYLESAKDAPDGHHYAKKLVIECPVNIDVYDGDTLICSLVDGQESDIENSYGRFICKYSAASGDYKKVLYFNNDDSSTYRAVIMAVSAGDVDITEASAGGASIAKQAGISLAQNGKIELALGDGTYTVDFDGTESNLTNGQLVSSNGRVALHSLTINRASLDLTVGASEQLQVSFAPENASYTDVNWTTSDNTVVSVSNGLVTAIGEGTATIHAVSGNVEAECAITVSTLHSHNLVAVNAKAPTCTEDGNIAYWQCSECGKYYSDENAINEIEAGSIVLPHSGHQYGAEWKYDSQYHWHECSIDHNKTDKTAHSFSWVIDREATKNSVGLKHEACICGAVRNENTEIPASETGSDSKENPSNSNEITLDNSKTSPDVNAPNSSSTTVENGTRTTKNSEQTSKNEIETSYNQKGESAAETTKKNSQSLFIPETGDESHILLWFALLSFSALFFLFTAYRRRNRANK